jgi:RNA polymerase sigma factor (TIGR02999 family)
MAGDITLLLQAARDGDAGGLTEVHRRLYAELRVLARSVLRGTDGTLSATALVHEAFLRLCGGAPVDLETRRHFFATAAQTMRWIVTDDARRRLAARHGGAQVRVELDEEIVADAPQPDEMLALDAALERLGRLDPDKKTLIELRFYAGLEYAELAELLGRSERTLKREWAAARAALQVFMEGPA